MNAYEERLREYLDTMETMAEHMIDGGHESIDRLWDELQTDAKGHRDNAVKGTLKRIDTEGEQISTWVARLSVIRDVKMIMNGEV